MPAGLRRVPNHLQIEQTEVPADDVIVVHAAAQEAAYTVRTTGRPFFLALNTYRLAPHSKGDDTRTPEELAAHWSRDPLARLAAELPAGVRTTIDAEVAARVAAAVAKALAAAPQTLAEFQQNAGWRSV